MDQEELVAGELDKLLAMAEFDSGSMKDFKQGRQSAQRRRVPVGAIARFVSQTGRG